MGLTSSTAAKNTAPSSRPPIFQFKGIAGSPSIHILFAEYIVDRTVGNDECQFRGQRWRVVKAGSCSLIWRSTFAPLAGEKACRSLVSGVDNPGKVDCHQSCVHGAGSEVWPEASPQGAARCSIHRRLPIRRSIGSPFPIFTVSDVLSQYNLAQVRNSFPKIERAGNLTGDRISHGDRPIGRAAAHRVLHRHGRLLARTAYRHLGEAVHHAGLPFRGYGARGCWYRRLRRDTCA